MTNCNGKNGKKNVQTVLYNCNILLLPHLWLHLAEFWKCANALIYRGLSAYSITLTRLSHVDRRVNPLTQSRQNIHYFARFHSNRTVFEPKNHFKLYFFPIFPHYLWCSKHQEIRTKYKYRFYLCKTFEPKKCHFILQFLLISFVKIITFFNYFIPEMGYILWDKEKRG